MRKLRFAYLVIVMFVLANIISLPVVALDSSFAQQNDIMFYNPNDAAAGCSAMSGNLVSLGAVPPETLAMIKSAGIDGMLAKTKDRYVYAEQQTGVPWQALAAIHYREGSMNPGASIADGEPLKDGKSIDGIQMSSDPNKDAALAAQHFLEMAKSVYGVTPSGSSASDAAVMGKSFLAYNRGAMYELNNKKFGTTFTYLDSPYVMNGFDAAHMNMSWVSADSYGGVNKVAGKKDSNLGALTIFNYLIGSGGTVSAATAVSSSGSCSSTAIASDTCSVTAPIYGEGGNRHQLTADELTRLYGPMKSTANQVEVDFLGKKVQVHKDVAGCLQAVANEIKTNNISYAVRRISGFRVEVGGGQVKDGSSYHQYGAAIDINDDTNPCCSVAKYDMPQAYIDAFHHHGWSWGGNWNSIKDYMHFEFNGKSL